MKNLKTFDQFINESDRINESLIQELYDMVEKSGNTFVDSYMDYQNFDQEVFFEFKANGINYRIHQASKEEGVTLTDMDSSESFRIESKEELTTYIN